MAAIAALDPGRDKCGLAVLQADGHTLWQRVVLTRTLPEQVRALQAEYGFTVLVSGNGTTSEQAEERLLEVLPQLHIVVLDEYRTTELAREYYWQAHPRHGWRRLLPLGLQTPPEPVDDFAAVILGRRYIAGQGQLAKDLPPVPMKLSSRTAEGRKKHE